jgi:hypothetical protein
MRTYHEISHFRAPYKNSYIAGFGQATPAVPAKPMVQPGTTAERVKKTFGGYEYWVMTEQGLALFLARITQDPPPNGTRAARRLKAGSLVGAIELPAESLAIVVNGDLDWVNWMQEMAQKGLGIVATETPPKEDWEVAASGTVFATRNVALASQVISSVGQDKASVLIEPSAGWVLPDSPEAKAEMGGMSTGTMVAIGVGAVVLIGGVYYLSKRKRGQSLF